MKRPFRPGLSTLLLALSLGLTTAMAQRGQPDPPPATIDRFITQLMDSAHVPGLSIALIRDNQLRYSQGYGLTKADSTQRVTAETVFDAASLSKPVFAYAVLQLVDEGRLDLDKPLYEYRPYPDIAADERYQKITARMVLSHRTGFRTGAKTGGPGSFPFCSRRGNGSATPARVSCTCKRWSRRSRVCP